MAITLNLADIANGYPRNNATFLWVKGKGVQYYESNTTTHTSGGYSAATFALSYATMGGHTDGYKSDGTGDLGMDLLTFDHDIAQPSIAYNLTAATGKLTEDLIIQASGSTKGWEINLGTADHGASVPAGRKVTVYGSAQKDTISGSTDAFLNGGGGDDIILAGKNKTVLGGGGNDTLIASGADDYSKDSKLTGVAGNNLFAVQDSAKVEITDFNYGRDLIALSTSSLNASLGTGSFAGYDPNYVKVFGYGNTTIDSAKDYIQYTVLDNAGQKHNVVSVKEASAFVDLSSATDSFDIYGGTLEGNAGNNTLHGGLKNDTIIAAKGDFVYGGGGNDTIYLDPNSSGDDRTAERVALTEAGGKDIVNNFGAGWEDGDDIVWFYDKAADISDVSVSGNDLILKQGKGQLTLKGVISTDKFKVQDENGLYKVGYAGELNSLTDADAAADIYLGTAKKNDTISFSGADQDIVADLGNTGKYAGSARYTSIEAVYGGNGNNTLVGSANADNTIAAGLGNASIYGGGKSNDYLIATEGGVNDSKTTAFFFGAGDGKDTIRGFHATEESAPENVRDTINFYSGDVTSVAKNNTALVINMKDKSSLTLNNAFIGLYDKLIGVNVLGQQSFAKIAGANEIVHYNSSAKYYVSVGTKGTVENSADGSKIYLDGRTGDSYKGFTNIKATAGDGLELAGDAAKNVVEYAGAGSASLYGGAGDDTLKGSTEASAVNTFYFGKKDGNDLIAQSAANDKVMLYDITLDDIKSAKVDNNVLKVALKGSSGSLTVNNFSTGSSVNEFVLADGTTWNYAGGTWTQKTTTTEE